MAAGRVSLPASYVLRDFTVADRRGIAGEAAAQLVFLGSSDGLI